MREKFIDFLEENSVYEEFVINLVDAGNYESIEELFEECDEEDYIDHAFTWAETVHCNEEVWEDLDEEWMETIFRG